MCKDSAPLIGGDKCMAIGQRYQIIRLHTNCTKQNSKLASKLKDEGRRAVSSARDLSRVRAAFD